MDDNYDISKLKTKKRVNSRAKGSTFERKICQIFNDRFKTTEFSRTPGSGAFATTHTLPDHLKIYGDLITPEKFKYCIECKKGYNKENLYSLYNYSSDFWKFIDQCEKDSEKCHKVPMVIFKQDRQPILVILPMYVSIPRDIKYIQTAKAPENLAQYRIYLLEDIIKCDEVIWFAS